MSENTKTVKVTKIIDSECADDNLKGDKVYGEVLKHLSTDGIDAVILDFENIALINTAFLNNAIGNLLRKYNLMEIGKRLKIKSIDLEDVEMIKEVIFNAAEKFSKIGDVENRESVS